jgi:hypothetical protein
MVRDVDEHGETDRVVRESNGGHAPVDDCRVGSAAAKPFDLSLVDLKCHIRGGVVEK